MDSEQNLFEEPTCAPNHPLNDANMSDENRLQVAKFCQRPLRFIGSSWVDWKREQKKSLRPSENLYTDCDHEKCQRTIVFWNIPHSMTIEQLWDHFQKFGRVRNSESKYYEKYKKYLRELKIEYLDVATAQKVVSYAKKRKFYSDRHTKPVLSPEQHVNKQNGEEDDESTSECFFNNLPHEVINNIFSYLNYFERIRVERVCKRWQHVNTKVTWVDTHSLKFQEKFNLNNQRILTTDILISILKRCGKTLRDINFDGCNHNLSNDLPTDISTYCPNLESVNLSKTSVTSDSLKNLVVACEYLQTVILRKCTGLTDKSLQHVLKEGKNVKYLDISKNLTITGECFNLVNDGLETLILNKCRNVTDGGFLQLQNKRIKCLGLNDWYAVCVEALTEVVKSLKPTLTDLNLKRVYETCLSTDEPNALQNVLEHCDNLHRLTLEEMFVIDDDSVRFISNKCLQLRCLNIDGNELLDDSIRTLRKLPHLRELYLNYSENMTDISLFDLSLNDQLERIEIRGSPLIGNEGCKALLKNCRKLKLLDISSCRNITDELVDEACALERADNVKLELIAGGTKITNFIDNHFLRVSSENLCPLGYRRATSDDETDSDDDDDSDEEFYGVCAGFECSD